MPNGRTACLSSPFKVPSTPCQRASPLRSFNSLVAGLFVGALSCVVPATADADILVGSDFTDSVLRYDETTGAFLGVFASGGGLNSPIGLVLGPDGNLYVTSFPGSVLRYNGTTGAFIDAFVPAGSGGLDAPQAVVFGPDGNLYVSSGGSGSVLRYNGSTGAFIDVFVPSGTGGLLTPLDLTFGPDGNLYVVASFVAGGGGVLRFNGATGAFVDLFVPFGGTALVFRPDGILYVANDGTHSVLRFDGVTGAFIDVFVSSGSGGLNFPVDLAFDHEGNLYVSSFFTDSVLRYSGTTGAFIDAFVPAGSGGLNGPTGLVFTPAVSIDIKPASFPNSINPRSRGVTPVAILTTATFDATTVDATTVRFGVTGTEAASQSAAVEDVDGDGDTDLLLHFRTQNTGIACGDALVFLSGETFSGQAIEASDSIRTVGCR
jgi:streptogramin lyase